MMRRLKKAMLLPVNKLAYHWKLNRLYYWAELELYKLRAVIIMPKSYYRFLYQVCMWLVNKKCFKKIADKTIHTIPISIRFEMA